MFNNDLISAIETETDTLPPVLPSPGALSGFVGQQGSITLLRKAMASKGGLPPTLISGPPGLGKSTLAKLVATELGRDVYPMLGENFWGEGVFLRVGADTKTGDVVIIDEVQSMTKDAQYMLQPRLENGGFNDYNNRWHQTGIILATMNQTKLLRSLRDRCVVQLFLDYYTTPELTHIAYNSREYFELEVGDMSAYFEIARRSRGFPRLTLRLSKLVSMYSPKTVKQVVEALTEIGIDRDGLTKQDRTYLDILRKSQRPMSLRTLAAVTGLDEDVIKEDIEPFLMRIGYIEVTGRGRGATLPK